MEQSSQKKFNVDYELYKDLKVNFSLYENDGRTIENTDNEEEVSLN